MSADNLARARAWIAQAWCTPATSHKVMDVDLADACATALAAAVRAKGKANAAIFDPWIVNAPEDQRCLIRNMQAVIRAHAADVPEVPS